MIRNRAGSMTPSSKCRFFVGRVIREFCGSLSNAVVTTIFFISVICLITSVRHNLIGGGAIHRSPPGSPAASSSRGASRRPAGARDYILVGDDEVTVCNLSRTSWTIDGRGPDVTSSTSGDDVRSSATGGDKEDVRLCDDDGGGGNEMLYVDGTGTVRLDRDWIERHAAVLSDDPSDWAGQCECRTVITDWPDWRYNNVDTVTTAGNYVQEPPYDQQRTLTVRIPAVGKLLARPVGDDLAVVDRETTRGEFLHFRCRFRRRKTTTTSTSTGLDGHDDVAKTSLKTGGRVDIKKPGRQKHNITAKLLSSAADRKSPVVDQSNDDDDNCTSPEMCSTDDLTASRTGNNASTSSPSLQLYFDVEQFVARIVPVDDVISGYNETISAAADSKVAGARKTEKQTDDHDDDLRQQFDVVVLALNGISRSSWERSMPRSASFVRNRLGGVVLNGFNALGDSASANLVPLITGSHYPHKPSPLRFLPKQEAQLML